MYIPPSPEVSIVNSKQHGEGRSAYITYTIAVNHFGQQWQIDRRYSEFVELHRTLHTAISTLPALPSKTWYNPAQWMKTMESSFIHQRQTVLEGWLREIGKFEYILRHSQYRAFLAITIHLPAVNDNMPMFEPRQLKTEISTAVGSLHHGINDCVYLESEFILLCACEAATMVGKLDAKVSGMKMPWSVQQSSTGARASKQPSIDLANLLLPSS